MCLLCMACSLLYCPVGCHFAQHLCHCLPCYGLFEFPQCSLPHCGKASFWSLMLLWWYLWTVVSGCGWLGSCVCVPECHHDCCCCLNGPFIYYLFSAFTICHFNSASDAFFGCSIMECFHLPYLRLFLLTPSYVIGLLCNDKGIQLLTLLYLLLDYKGYSRHMGLLRQLFRQSHEKWPWSQCQYAHLSKSNQNLNLTPKLVA